MKKYSHEIKFNEEQFLKVHSYLHWKWDLIYSVILILNKSVKIVYILLAIKYRKKTVYVIVSNFVNGINI